MATVSAQLCCIGKRRSSPEYGADSKKDTFTSSNDGADQTNIICAELPSRPSAERHKRPLPGSYQPANSIHVASRSVIVPAITTQNRRHIRDTDRRESNASKAVSDQQLQTSTSRSPAMQTRHGTSQSSQVDPLRTRTTPDDCSSSQFNVIASADSNRSPPAAINHQQQLQQPIYATHISTPILARNALPTNGLTESTDYERLALRDTAAAAAAAADRGSVYSHAYCRLHGNARASIESVDSADSYLNVGSSIGGGSNVQQPVRSTQHELLQVHNNVYTDDVTGPQWQSLGDVRCKVTASSPDGINKVVVVVVCCSCQRQQLFPDSAGVEAPDTLHQLLGQTLSPN